MSRFVCQFSCGAASAVATKLILAENPAEVLIVNAFLVEEHADNRRFLADCEHWFGMPIAVVRDEKYGASALEVWRRKRFIKNFFTAPCSEELKRRPLRALLGPGDVQVFGFTAEEFARFERIQDLYPGEEMRAPLIEAGLTKGDCFAILDRAGIELPLTYRMGYPNGNCLMCPKGGQAYWQNIREDFPANFVAVQELQKELGAGASFLRFRSGPRTDERMSLAELPAGRGDMGAEPDFTCSFFCALAEQKIQEVPQ